MRRDYAVRAGCVWRLDFVGGADLYAAAVATVWHLFQAARLKYGGSETGFLIVIRAKRQSLSSLTDIACALDVGKEDTREAPLLASPLHSTALLLTSSTRYGFL